jgi:hypothetical protein
MRIADVFILPIISGVDPGRIKKVSGSFSNSLLPFLRPYMSDSVRKPDSAL